MNGMTVDVMDDVLSCVLSLATTPSFVSLVDPDSVYIFCFHGERYPPCLGVKAHCCR